MVALFCIVTEQSQACGNGTARCATPWTRRVNVPTRPSSCQRTSTPVSARISCLPSPLCTSQASSSCPLIRPATLTRRCARPPPLSSSSFCRLVPPPPPPPLSFTHYFPGPCSLFFFFFSFSRGRKWLSAKRCAWKEDTVGQKKSMK